MEETIRFGSQAPMREEALELVLSELQREILDSEKCNKAFRIYETKTMDFGGVQTVFKIEEIKVNTDYLILPYGEIKINEDRKFTLKERLRILFKGR